MKALGTRVLLLSMLFATASRAQDSTAAPPDAAPWRVAIRPYFFLAGVSGSVTSGSNTIPINSTFGELLDNVQLSIFTAIGLVKGRWGLYADFQYISLNAEGTGQLGTTVGLENIIVEADATFQPPGASGLRLLAGLRGYRVDQTVNFSGQPPVKATTTVVDPVVGALGAWNLGERWQFEFRGDIGGFGVSSEFTSQLSLVVLYDISQTVSIPLGYRILGYRIKTDDVWMDTGMGGLVVGVDIRP